MMFGNIESVAFGWIGTPFHPNACIKGVGCSCQGLVAGIYKELGVLPVDFQLPEGPMDWAHANAEPYLEPIMARYSGVFTAYDLGAAGGPSIEDSQRRPVAPIPFSVDDIQPGDMLGFQFGRCIHHCGISISPSSFIHVWRGPGVTLGLIHDACFISRIKKVWRPNVVRR